MEEEVWKDIPGYEGRYQVSNIGRLKSIIHPNKNKILRPWFNRFNRPMITIYGKNYEKRHYQIHRLILLAFVGPCPDGMEACHKDDIKTNNRLENLYWGTKKDNDKDMIINNRRAKGSKVGTSILKEEDVIKIKLMLKEKNKNCREIGDLFNVSDSVIQMIKSNKNWKHIEV